MASMVAPSGGPSPPSSRRSTSNGPRPKVGPKAAEGTEASGPRMAATSLRGLPVPATRAAASLEVAATVTSGTETPSQGTAPSSTSPSASHLINDGACPKAAARPEAAPVMDEALVVTRRRKVVEASAAARVRTHVTLA